MVRGPEEDLLWPTDNGSEEEDKVMEEPTMQELPSAVREQRNLMMEELLSVVREQPDSMMEERLMWEYQSLIMGEQSWWLKQQRWWLLQKQILQDPDWMMEGTDRMADGNSTEGDDAIGMEMRWRVTMPSEDGVDSMDEDYMP